MVLVRTFVRNSAFNFPLQSSRIAVLVAACFVAAALGRLAWNWHESQPSITCAQPTFSFGEWRTQEPLEHLFVVQNDGRAPLRILDVKTSCVCTVVPLFNRMIPPGGMVIIPVRLDLAGHKGKVQQSALLKTNDPARPYFRLHLVGSIAPEVPGQAPIVSTVER